MEGGGCRGVVAPYLLPPYTHSHRPLRLLPVLQAGISCRSGSSLLFGYEGATRVFRGGAGAVRVWGGVVVCSLSGEEMAARSRAGGVRREGEG